jgi:hypothetical protein
MTAENCHKMIAVILERKLSHVQKEFRITFQAIEAMAARAAHLRRK